MIGNILLYARQSLWDCSDNEDEGLGDIFNYCFRETSKALMVLLF
jgi:hypothetical protein